ncbi:MAG TPA: DPP IV N-terminal domain-containing protein, partial [Candidatus Binatia bacterium]|nr:DPP IV N-terminal domain-containing protein [Candidatus Binatia bacterium]
MPKTFSRISLLIAILVLVGLSVLGCAAQVTTTPEPESTVTVELTPTPEIRVTPRNTEEVVIFSYEEDGFAHLFAYIPGKLPLTRLTSGNWDDITPSASPDGEKVAFASNRSGYWDLYLLDLGSGETSQLTDTPDYEGAPTWSPDGAFLAFEAYEEDNLEIVVGPSKDPLGDSVHLTTSPASDHSPAWAPDGRHIAFISTESGNSEVIVADLDRTDGNRFQNLSNTELAAESHP